MGLNFKKWFKDEENDVFGVDGVEDSYYALKPEEALKDNNGGSKMILLEPRAYSESQQIVDHLKNRNTVVVNLKRVTSDQAKRIVDFLSGTIYAIGGDIQKLVVEFSYALLTMLIFKVLSQMKEMEKISTITMI